MIRFLFIIILILAVYLYLKYYEHHPYFFIKRINHKYNLVELNFFVLNKRYYIEKEKLILLEEDANDLIDVLEELYIDNIVVDLKGI